MVPQPHDIEACGEIHLALFLTLEVNTGKVIHKLLMILSWRWIKLIIPQNHDYSNRPDTGKHAMQGNPGFSGAHPASWAKGGKTE